MPGLSGPLYAAGLFVGTLSTLCAITDVAALDGDRSGVEVAEALGSERGWDSEVHRFADADDARGTADALTLREAIARALARHPAVKSAYVEIGARHGEVAQAAVRPNPEILLEVENFGGTKDKSGFQSAEETLSLTQLVELGHKRFSRLQAAHLDASLAAWDFEAVRLRVATDTARAFVDVLVAQERVRVLQEFVSIATKTRSSVDARVKGGKASPIELDRVIVVAARAKAALDGEKVKVHVTKRRLAVFWGGSGTDFGHAAGRLGNGSHVPSLEALVSYLDANPQLARWSDEIGRRVAQVGVEHAKSVPDLKFQAGVRQFNENDSVAAIASVSIPLPLFDRNAGSIAAAEQRVAKAEYDRAAARTDLLGALVEAVGELEIAAAQVTALERTVLPPARTAFERTQIGYAEGKFDILDVLDAQRAVFDVRLDLLGARAEYAKARAKVEALIGRDVRGL